MLLVRVLLVAVFGDVIMSAAYGAEPADIQISVATERLANDDFALNIQLQYRGSKSLSVYQSDLPWGIRNSLLLLAVCLDGNKSLIPEANFIDDPSPSRVELMPGQVLKGTVLLGQRFPTLHECLRKKDALVFWSYHFTPVGGHTPFPRQSGGLLIGR